MLKITRDLLATIRKHALQHYPEECVGLIIGRETDEARYAERILPLKNNFDPGSRYNRYLIKPQDMIDAEVTAEGMGREIIGVFHSHPDHPALPSEFDRERAWPWYSYVITSVYDGEILDYRSWRLSDEHQFSEEEIQIYSQQMEAT